MEGDAGPLCHGILQRTRILHPFRGVHDLDPNNVAILVLVENDPGFILITFLNRSTTQLNGEHVDFLVAFTFMTSSST